MKYSVWNQGTGLFDYYETTAQAKRANVEKPSHLQNRTLGSTVEQAAWPLPSGAKLVGQGELAVGRVAVKSGSASSLGFDLVSSNTGLIVGGLALLYFLWRSR